MQHVRRSGHPSRYAQAGATALSLMVGACTGELEAGGTRGVHDATPHAPPAMRRLSAQQYLNSVADLLGDGVAPTTTLEADISVNGFVALGTSRMTVSPRGAELYEQAALEVADQAMGDATRRDALVPCTPSGTVDAECAREVITELGHRAWRRPLTPAELDTYTAIATRSAEVLGNFHEGLEMAIAGLLQSPNFLFRVEVGEPIPEGGRRYTSLEMASRLSFALWNSIPDDALLAAGERGELATEEGVREAAWRLLDSPRASTAVRAFFGELLRLEALDRLPQDATDFPLRTETIGASMREGTLLTIEHQLWERDGGYRSLFDSRTTFVDQDLAALYGVPARTEPGFAQVELPADGARGGILGEGHILALLSHASATSPTVRGKFVREALLCQSIPPPPPDVGELPEPSPDLPTMRERLREHRENPACATCHAVTDPIGLGLENFDAIGAFRERENGALIDPSGELDGTSFADARGLGEALRDHPDLTRCLVRNLYRYSSGHVETTREARMLDRVALGFEDEGLRTLMVEIVSSSGFRLTSEAE